MPDTEDEIVSEAAQLAEVQQKAARALTDAPFGGAAEQITSCLQARFTSCARACTCARHRFLV